MQTEADVEAEAVRKIGPVDVGFDRAGQEVVGIFQGKAAEGFGMFGIGLWKVHTSFMILPEKQR